MKRYPRTAVSLLFGINGLQFASWASRLPDLQARYGLDHGGLGLTLLLLSLGALLAMPFTGWVITRFGSRRVTVVGGVLFCVFTPVVAFGSEVPLLLGLFFLLGCSTGMMDVAMNAQAVEVEKWKGRPIMASFHAVFSMGMMGGAGSGRHAGE
ncbi:MAG: MFS transporter, partial [Bacteroidetes bacterium]